MLTVVCKATYLLFPGESPLAPDQDPPNETDDHWDDDERRSLHGASDLAPFKSRADVFLVGHAYAPQSLPLASLVARLVVGEADKAIEVHADRGWMRDGSLHEGAPFSRMPLVYERAAGGPQTSNPVGIPASARPDRHGRVPVPNLHLPGAQLVRPGATLRPVGFGPIAPTWPGRAAKLSGEAAGWDHRRWNAQPLPRGIDPGFFNAAPPDQQLGELRHDTRMVLENLHPEHARLGTTLRGLSPRAVVEREGGVGQPLPLRCDTLCIDTDRGVCSVVWRGQVSLARPDERGRVVIRLEAAGEDEELQTLVGAMPVPEGRESARAEAPWKPELETTLQVSGSAQAAALPFQARSPWAGSPAAGVSRGGKVRGEDEDWSGTVRVDTRRGRPSLPFVEQAGSVKKEGTPVPVPSPAVPAMEPEPARQVEPEVAEALREAPAPPPMIGPLATPEMSEAREPAEREEARPAATAEAPAEEPAPAQAARRVELSIEQVAGISAEIAEKRAPRAEILRSHDLTEEAWAATERHWKEALDEEASRGSSRLRRAGDAAYVARVEGFRGPITASEYARLVIALERGRADRELDALGIQRPALMRIVRVWTAKVARDAQQSKEVGAVVAAMREG